MAIPNKPKNLDEAIEWASVLEAWITEQDASEYTADDYEKAHELWDKLDDAKSAAFTFEDAVQELEDEDEDDEEIESDSVDEDPDDDDTDDEGD